MKIRGIGLKNFRNHKDSYLALEKTNFIVGANNSGKSSVKGGLELALTGKTGWTGSRNFKDLIANGEDQALVEVELDGLGIIERGIRATGSYIELNSSKLPGKELEQEMIDNFGLTTDILSSVLSSTEFLGLSDNKQKDFLFTLTGAKLDVDKIIEFMIEPTDKAIEAINKELSGIVDIDQLDTIYKEFFAERKFKKKVRDDLKSKLELMDIVPSSSGIDTKAVNESFTENEKAKRVLIGKKATISQKSKQKKQLESYIIENDKKIVVLKDKIDKDIDVAKSEELLFDFVADISKAETDIDNQKKIINIRKENITLVSKMLTKLSTPSCPLSDKLVCKTDKTPLMSEFKEDIEKSEKDLDKAEKSLAKANLKLAMLKAKKQHIESQVKLVADLYEVETRQKQLVKDLSEIKVETLEGIEEQIKSYEEVTEQLNEKIMFHKAWEKEKKTYEKLIKDLAMAEEELVLYEYLVKEFSSKGVKSRILEKIIGPIEKHCNKTLSKLTDEVYAVEFDFSDGFDLLVSNKTGKSNVNLLSSSEKLRIGIVLQDAINEVTGAKILLIDDAEIMDRANRELFINLINTIESNYDTIIIIATSNSLTDTSTFASYMKSKCAVFTVDSGNVDKAIWEEERKKVVPF